MILTLQALITYLVLGVIGGTVAEEVAKRKRWPPFGLIGAMVVAFGGTVIGAWFFGSVLGLKDPSLFDSVPIIPALVGLLIFAGIWFFIRGGYAPTQYSQTHTWQRKYRR